MKCKYDKEQFSRLLVNDGNEEGLGELRIHLGNCEECRAEFASTEELWHLMEQMPKEEAPAGMRADFNAMLDNYKASLRERTNPMGSFLQYLKDLWNTQPRLQLGYGIVLVLVAFGIGYLTNRSFSGNSGQISQLSSQVQEMRNMMTLSLLENPSAAERIKAVGYVSDVKKVDHKVAEALLTTLNNDPNVNVRLITLEALANLADDPYVREGLVQSIVQQESPLVQSALADVMVKLQERRSVKPLQKLLHKEETNEAIKSKIQQSLLKLS
jgi:hypothetical protein